MSTTLLDRYRIVIDHSSGAKLTIDGEWQSLEFPATLSDDEVEELKRWAERVFAELKVTEGAA